MTTLLRFVREDVGDFTSTGKPWADRDAAVTDALRRGYWMLGQMRTSTAGEDGSATLWTTIKKLAHMGFVTTSDCYRMATVLIDGGRFLLPDGTQREGKRLLFFGLWLILTAALLWKPVEALVRYSLGNDNASHIVLIPFISAWLLYFEQKRIFERVSSDYVSGAVLLLAAAGVALWTLRSAAAWTETQALSGYTLALVLLWAGGFALIFGRVAMGKARFALLFLLLMIPPPDSWLNYSVYLLQKGSADIAEFIFDLAGVPALRDGFVFHLAHLSIEVAKECSGIRSSLALLILALLVGHLFLRTFWKQAVFVVVGLVIMIVKNGIRIATLTILAQYVDSGFLYGRLHHEGGVVFFLIGLVLLLPVFWLLQRGETPRTAVQDAAAG